MILFMSTIKDDPVSALIRRMSMCDWSHTGFYRLEDGWTFSAMNDGKGVAWRPPNPKATILKITAPGVEDAFSWALKQEGKPYDRLDIAGFVFDRDWQNPSSFICDRLNFLAFINASLIPGSLAKSLLNHKFIPLEHLTPRDILVSNLVTQVF